jgi:hypothetical protein
MTRRPTPEEHADHDRDLRKHDDPSARMRFILVECKAPLIYLPPYRQWRATHVKPDGNPIDLFFWALDVDRARQHVRDRFPETVFSDDRELED